MSQSSSQAITIRNDCVRKVSGIDYPDADFTHRMDKCSKKQRNYGSYLEALQSDYAPFSSLCLRPPCRYFSGVSISSAARTQISICSWVWKISLAIVCNSIVRDLTFGAYQFAISAGSVYCMIYDMLLWHAIDNLS